jgi:hypothetical protein
VSREKRFRESAPQVIVYVDSSLTGRATLRSGQIAVRGDGDEVDRILTDAARVYSSIPSRLRPDRVEIHLRPRSPEGVPPVKGIEFHRSSRSILVGRTTVDRTAWLHEMAHVRMGAPQHPGRFQRRIFAALEEGIADYFSSSIADTALLGGIRNLDHPPRWTAGDWESAAIERLSFDPQKLGWVLAARLRELERRPGPLLEDLITCMSRSTEASADETLSASIDAWLRGCPERSRDRIRTVLQGWIPAELSAG